MTAAVQDHPATLVPNSFRERVVMFEVKATVQPARFRLSLRPGAAGQTQDWRLP